MAYITADQVKNFRNQIKAAFPVKKGWKWSVTGKNHSSVDATLMQFPKGYTFPTDKSMDVNHHYLDETKKLGKKEIAVFKKVNEILHSEHWDKSDIMTDYFHCAYYVNMGIGKWNKPAVQAISKVKKPIKNAVPATQYERDFEQVARFIGIQF